MKGLFGLLNDARYPSLDCLVYAILDRLENELLEIKGNIESGEYTNEELAEQVENLRKRIIRS